MEGLHTEANIKPTKKQTHSSTHKGLEKNTHEDRTLACTGHSAGEERMK